MSPELLNAQVNAQVSLGLYRHFQFKKGLLVFGYPVIWPPQFAPRILDFRDYNIDSQLTSPLAPPTIWPSYRRTTTYFATASLGFLLIPLWFPTAVLVATTMITLRIDLQRRRNLRKDLHVVRRERLGATFSGVLALAIFFLSLFAMPSLYFSIDEALSPDGLYQYLRWSVRIPELAISILLLFVAIFASYVIARVGFFYLHWRTCYEDRLRCVKCSYELTGNVSGICPECGTAIQDRVTPTPSA